MSYSHRYPSLLGLADWVSTSSVEENDYTRFFQLAGSIRDDEATGKPVLHLDLTMSFEVEKTFTGTDEIASTCNSLSEQLSTKANYANVFSGAVNVSKFQSGSGCGRVTVEGEALLRAIVGVDFEKVLALANFSASGGIGAAINNAVVDAADVIAGSTISIHPDTRFEVDVVAQPPIPFVETDIRLHLLAQVGKQDPAAAPLLFSDLMKRNKLLRYFRKLKWEELAGDLDATFRAQFDVNLDFLGINRNFKFEPVLSLSSDNLLGSGFGLTPLIDIGLSSSEAGSSDTTDLEDLFTNIAESTLDKLENLIDGVKGLNVPDLPSLFEPLKETGWLKISSVAKTFKKLWTSFAKWRSATSLFIKLTERYALKTKVLEYLEALIFEITGINVKENRQYVTVLAALAHISRCNHCS